MSYAAKFNKSGSKFTFRTGNEVDYLSLEDLFTKNPVEVHPVRALYINTKSKYGDRPCIVVDECTVINLPEHMLDDVKAMINDSECVDEINNGKVCFKVYQYQSKNFNRTCFGVEWI